MSLLHLPCRCGHAASAHEHYRRGTDCGQCGVEGCARYSVLRRPLTWDRGPAETVRVHHREDEELTSGGDRAADTTVLADLRRSMAEAE